jgi:uncharacterized membrane protein YjfL (UPF0719 family)
VADGPPSAPVQEKNAKNSLVELVTIVAVALGLAGLILGIPIVLEYLDSGLVPRLPTAILASVVELLAFMTFFLGLTLSALKRTKDENIRLVYLSMKPPAAGSDADEG